MILGIHDGHDSGAALINKGRIVAAVNEERFTKEKNDTGFPFNSIEYLLSDSPEIDAIAIGWVGGYAFFGRVLPIMDERRRLLWRKKLKKPSRFSMQLTNLAFRAVQNQRPQSLWRSIGNLAKFPLKTRLKRIGLDRKKIFFVDHHMAHAASAYYTSGFDPCLVITMDGSGDGLCGSICVGENGELKRIKKFAADSSLGLLYGAVTLALDMKYSEDEGKVMSLAPYSYPTEIKELKHIVKITNGEPKSNFPIKYELLLSEWIKDKILWRYNREALAFGIQKHLEDCFLEIVKSAIEETGIHSIAVAGGLFSNVILNMKIRLLPEVKNFYVFPHMSDGGLAIGASLYIDNILNGHNFHKQLNDVYFGPSYSNDEILNELKNYNTEIKFEERTDIPEFVGELIPKQKIILWFQGRVELGPRALGNRSILAPAESIECKNELNLIIKRRPYFQPFCPSILEEDADKILEDYDVPSRFMTIAYKTKENMIDQVKAVVHIDDTTRPQILGNENEKYRKVIETVKKETGLGIVLNTSFNKHGFPMVGTPEHALWTFLNSNAKYLAIGDYFVEKK
jgi:carbamoyltransferase